jgi:glycosyltransferase involved in cell wall biosynthesis
MCRSLIAAGVDVMLASTDADGPTRLDLTLGVPTTWNDVPAIFFHRNATESFKYSYGLSRWLRRHVCDYDVVHIHAVLSHASLAAAAACRADSVPYIVRPVGAISKWSLSQKPWRKRLLLALAAKRMLTGAAALHCTSEEERRGAAHSLGLTQGVVIPHGVNADAYTPQPAEMAMRDEHPYVLSLSRLHPVKNIEALIDAFATARAGLSTNWTLVIAGGGDEAYAKTLADRVQARGLAHAVTFTGWVDGTRKRDLLVQASLFALPSSHENFGVAVIEAAAAHLPVLISSTVQLADAVRAAHAGWIVPSETALADVLREALVNLDERRARGHAAAAMAQQFSWSSVASQLQTLYRQVIANAARTESAPSALAAAEKLDR